PASERLERLRGNQCRQTGTLVADVKADALLRLSAVEPYRASTVAEGVGDHGETGRLDHDPAAGLACAQLEAAGHRRQQRADVEAFATQWEDAPIGACEQQEILGQPHEPVRLLAGGAERRAKLISAAFLLERELDLALQQRERSAQL